MKPGTTARPRRSTISVRGPASPRTSSLVPTAANLPADTANACAIRDAGSTTMTLPLMKIASGKLEVGRCAAAAVHPNRDGDRSGRKWSHRPIRDCRILGLTSETACPSIPGPPRRHAAAACRRPLSDPKD